MNPFYRMIKSKNLIDFCKLVLDKYHLLGLSETEAIILIKLHDQIQQGVRKLSVQSLAPTMTLSANTISKKLVDLVKNGFVTLSLSEADGSEMFDLEETYKRLGHLLENDDQQTVLKTSQTNQREVALLIEQEFKKMLTAMDLEMIQHWLNEDQFSVDQIKAAVLKCVKARKLHIKYVDIFLNQKEESTQSKPVENLQELFNSVYEKSK